MCVNSAISFQIFSIYIKIFTAYFHDSCDYWETVQDCQIRNLTILKAAKAARIGEMIRAQIY